MWAVASPPRRRGPHRTGDVGLTASATTQECTQIGGNGLSMSFWGICVHCWASRGSFERPWGRRSVHRSAKMAPRRRFGAFVYTVATRVATRIATRAACVRWRERLNRHGVPAAPLAGPSRLVGKTGSERVAPLPGWRLRRGVSPHEPPKSQIIWESPDSPRWFQKMMTATPFGSVAVRTSNAAQPTQGVC